MKRDFPQKVTAPNQPFPLTDIDTDVDSSALVNPGSARQGLFGSGRTRSVVMMGLALTTGATPLLLQQRVNASAPARHLPTLSDALLAPESESAPAPGVPVQYTALATYTVQPGETLWGIAQQFDLSVEDLAALNRLIPNSALEAGQAIRVPARSNPQTPLIALNRDPVAAHVETLTQEPPDAADQAEGPKEAAQVPVLATLPPETSSPLFQAAEGNSIRRSTSSEQPLQVATRSPSPERALPPAEFTPSRSDTYVVRAGDTLTLIANRFGLDPSALSNANGISNPNLIFVGQQLRIPAGSNAEAPLVAAASPVATVAAANLTQLDLALSTPIASQGSSRMGDRRQLALLTDLPSPDPQPSQATTRLNAVSYINQLQSDIRAIGTQQPVPAVAPPSELVASAPIGSENYQPLLSAVLERSFSTELAPPKFDNLLPNGGSVFQGYVWPAQGVLSSGFGWRWGRMHKGIDIAAPIGTPVVAAAPGVITYSGWNEGGYGNLVEITHPDGSVTLYAHNHRVLVSLGQRVNQGQQVAEMGSTGRSTGPHLHFEIHPAGSGAANPMAYLPRGGRES